MERESCWEIEEESGGGLVAYDLITKKVVLGINELHSLIGVSL
jgi:hypothetical protein